MIDWAQYYTPSAQSETLIELLPPKANLRSVKTVFDLGAGRGDLLAAAGMRWPKAKLYAVDIDGDNIATMQIRFPKARCIATDALHYDLPRRLGLDEASADIAVANPPYGALQNEPDALKLLQHVGLADVVSHKRLNREIVFLAQNLRMLRTGGALVAIVPEGLGSCIHFGEFRAALMQRHGLFKAVELAPNTFAGTEAKTLALFMIKGGDSHSLTWTSATGCNVELSPDQVQNRLDGHFHQLRGSTGSTLADIDADIRRGNITHADGRKLGGTIFHTTHFQAHPTGLIRLPKRQSIVGTGLLAGKGDILMARVGTRCIGRVGWVKSGAALVTDCVYRIRVKPELQRQVFDALRSEQGQLWLNTAAHGTCAQLVSKRDLLTCPVIF